MICAKFAALILYWSAEFHVPSQIVDGRIFAESSCKANVVHHRTGAVGLGQILPGGSASLGYNARKLRRPSLNIALTAAHLRRTFDLCGDWRGAVRVYTGYRTCRVTREAR